MNRLATQSNPYADMVASHLRSQVVLMHNVLESIERAQEYDTEYVSESIKTVEYELKRLRKFLEA